MQPPQKKTYLQQSSNTNIKAYQKALKNPIVNSINLKEKAIEWLFSHEELTHRQKICTIDNTLTVSLIYSMYIEYSVDKRNMFLLKSSTNFPEFFIYPSNTPNERDIEANIYNYLEFTSKGLTEPKKSDSTFLKQIQFFTTSNSNYFTNITLGSNILKEKQVFSKIFEEYNKQIFNSFPDIDTDDQTKLNYIKLTSNYTPNTYYSLVDLLIFFFEQIIMIRYLLYVDTGSYVSFKLVNKEFNNVFEEYSTLTKFLTDSVNKKGDKSIEILDFKTILESVTKDQSINEILKKKSKKDFGHYKSYYTNSKASLKKNPIFDCNDQIKFKNSVFAKLRFGAVSFMESIFFVSFRRIWSFDSFVSGKLYEEVNKLYKEKLIQDLLEDGFGDEGNSSKKKGKKKKNKKEAKIITINESDEYFDTNIKQQKENKDQNFIDIQDKLFSSPLINSNGDNIFTNSFSYEISQSNLSNNNFALGTILDMQNQKEKEEDDQKDINMNSNNIIIVSSDDIMLQREELLSIENKIDITNNQESVISDTKDDYNNSVSILSEVELKSKSFNINNSHKTKQKIKKQPKSFFLYDTSKLSKKSKSLKPMNIANHAKSLIKTFQKFDEREYPFLFWQRLHNDIIDFSLHVNDNVSLVRPIKIEMINVFRSELINEIESIINIIVYGSLATDLSIETSDVDLRVVFRDNTNINDEIVNFITFCNKKTDLFVSIKPIISASVPVIKLIVDLKKLKPSSKIVNERLEVLEKNKFNYPEDVFLMKLDITFSTENAPETKEVIDSVNYINKYSNKFPEILPIIYILKHALQKTNLNSAYNGSIPSFSLFLIVLAFTLFQRNIVKKSITYNLGTFLYEMLDFYGNSLNFLKYKVEINLNGK